MIALIRDEIQTTSTSASFLRLYFRSSERWWVLVRASFNQRRLISISEHRLSQPPRRSSPSSLFPLSIVVERCLSSSSFFLLSFFFSSFLRARVHDRLSRPLGTAHNYSSGTLPNSRSLITVFERHARSVNGCRRDRRFKLLYWIVDGVSGTVIPSTALLPLCLLYGVCILERWFGPKLFPPRDKENSVHEIDWIINSENYSVYFLLKVETMDAMHDSHLFVTRGFDRNI